MMSPYGLEILVDYVVSKRRAEADRERLATRAPHRLWPPLRRMRWPSRRLSQVLVGLFRVGRVTAAGLGAAND